MKVFTRRNLILFLGLPALLIAGLYMRRGLDDSATPAKVARVRIGDLVQTFRTNGVVEAVDSREIRAEFPSQVLAVLVKEGDQVRAGQSLARLDDRDARAAVAQARSQLFEAQQELAKAQSAGTLRQIDSQIAQAKSDAALAASNLRRDQTLLKQRAISQLDFDQTAAAYQKASDQLAALEKQRDTLAQQLDPLAQKQAEAHVEQAQVALQNAEKRLRATQVPAPISGTVLVKPPRPGTLINVGDLLGQVADLDHLQVRAFIDQPDFSSIQIGSPVLITSSGFPGENWQGSVVSLSPALTTMGRRIVGEAVCSIKNGRDSLPVNSNVDLSFTSRELHNVLLAPVDAVFQKDNRNYVYVVKAGKLQLLQVQTGASNSDSIVIASGLQTGDMVLDDLEVRPSEGMRVEPQPTP